MERYNPIVRTFNRLRAELISSGIERRYIIPAMPLELLLPADQRREIWQHLRQASLELPVLLLSPEEWNRNAFLALKTAASLALGLKTGFGLLAFLPLGLIANWSSRSRAIHFPRSLMTVGELVLFLTRFSDHTQSGYRWTANEISTKVRLVIAESMGLELDKVQPETPLHKLGA